MALQRDEPILGIQYLRGIAALMVVFHHARHYFGDVSDWTRAGAAGVDIFFVISGFIMAFTTQAEPGRRAGTLRSATGFLLKRFVRVVPLYWLALLWTSRWRIQTLEIDSNIWKDFLFVPHFHRNYPNEIWPTLIPGWTINLEIFFYLLFGLSMLTGRWKLLVASVSLFVLALIGGILNLHDAGPVLRFYTSRSLLEFAMGILVFVAYSKTRTAPLSRPWALGALALAFCTLCLEDPYIGALSNGIPAMIMVWASLYAFQGWNIVPLKLLGDASYSIYLFHLASFEIVERFLHATGVGSHGLLRTAFILATHIFIASCLGILIYYAIERPMLSRLRGLVRKFQPHQ